MHRWPLLLVFTALALTPAWAGAADKSANKANLPEFKPLMTEPGKLLFQDDLTLPISRQWKAGKGKWEIVDGAMRVAESPADKHGAVARHTMPFQDAIIQYSFKIDGARSTSLSINKDKGHLCRVVLTPSSLTLRKDASKKGVDDAAVLATCPVSIKPGEWHTILIEMRGKEMVASLDGKEIVGGEHPDLTAPRANFGFTVAGDSVSFKNLRVWEALPNAAWPATRAKLLPKK